MDCSNGIYQTVDAAITAAGETLGPGSCNWDPTSSAKPARVQTYDTISPPATYPATPAVTRSSNPPLSYRDAGVDIETGEMLVTSNRVLSDSYARRLQILTRRSCWPQDAISPASWEQ